MSSTGGASVRVETFMANDRHAVLAGIEAMRGLLAVTNQHCVMIADAPRLRA